ncbi:sugar ABC transporter permease [Paenibacillus chitinolyticus]|uniref:Sugar ABC transporter permease n=1 Tax=Paenibacillus chitinolyticus TaxID=79263 RepID=A0A410WUP4_9BACL|nr:sugar ABC transporter permease [Paenibacillus chitinolyticus]MCY9594076.1 sugar ABC transporter permease [Paenibacillus chitinolyticus]MCY9596161.1 sugar ABC transporter permease [Paenibacillus chitinolyticus]QAV18108.1 sugar ABC transporter permease [Paenibacillus chitinolyticus]
MRWFSSNSNKIIMLLPTMLLYMVYIILPIIIAAYYSLTRFTGIGKPKFTGMSNYLRLFNDPIFMVALKNTFIVLVVTLIILIPAAFLLSLLLNKKMKGLGVIRAINYSPSIIAPIMVGLIWVFILDPKIGLINNVLNMIGLESWALQWIGGDKLTPFSVAVVQSWQSLGYIATIFLAGLTLIPKEMYEAADIDGATKFQQLRNITVPLLGETFKLNIILAITLCFKIFETVLQLTNGGPNHLSDVLVTYMYSTTFNAGEYGYGMAIAVASLIATILLTGIILGMFTFGKRMVNSEGARKA